MRSGIKIAALAAAGLCLLGAFGFLESEDAPEPQPARRMVSAADAGVRFVRMATTNVNLDVNEDVILQDERGGIHLLLNEGKGKFAKPRLIVEAVNAEPGPCDFVLSDTDLDNDEDIFVGDSYGRVFKVLNEGQLRFSRPLQISEMLNPEQGPFRMGVSDVDLDNDEDIILVNSQGVVWQITNAGMGSFGMTRRLAEIRGLTPGPIELVFSDLTLNNAEDILVADSRGTVYRLTNSGSGSFGSPQRIMGPMTTEPGRVFLRTMDMDFDGEDDILLMVGDGTVYSLKNRGRGDFAAQPLRASAPVSTQPGLFAMASSELESELGANFIVAHSGSAVYFVESDGQTGFKKPQAISTPLKLKDGGLFALREDLNGDGAADTLLLDGAGDVYFVRGTLELLAEGIFEDE